MSHEIDFAVRRHLSGLLRQFAIGRITNREFDKAFDNIRSNDKTVWAIGAATFWDFNMYQTVRLTGRYHLTSAERKQVARWILFLQSGLTYQNIQPPFPTRLRAFLSSCTFGIVSKGRRADEDERYQRDVWPFSTQTQLEEARRHPKLLCGLSA